MRIFFSVGEPSGDLHASNLICELKHHWPRAKFVGFGGPKMKVAGCEVIFDLTTLAVMFLSGVFKNLKRFFSLISQAEEYFENHRVDAVVLIDYPGLNWWIARKAKKYNIPVFYYGVPQMWAWAPWRIRKLRRLVDHVICKLPFEKKWFEERGCQAHYVGHPYFDQLDRQNLDSEFVAQWQNDDRETLVLLPGSRDTEVERNWPELQAIANQIQLEKDNVRVAVGCYSSKHAEFVRSKLAGCEIQILVGRTQELMTVADVCVACSGSVSLELLYHRLPSIIVYKISWLKTILRPFLLRSKYISLPNLMAVENIQQTGWQTYHPDDPQAESIPMPEYLTHQDCWQSVSNRVIRWLDNKDAKSEIRSRLDQLAKWICVPGATKRAAEYIVGQLETEIDDAVAA